MFHQLATKLFQSAAPDTGSTEYSRAVQLTPLGTVEVQVTAIHLQGGSIGVHLEQSDDLENWTEPDPLTFVNLLGVGYGVVKITAISSRWVRLRYLLDAGGQGASSIVAAGIRVEDFVPAPEAQPLPDALRRELTARPRSGSAGPLA